MRCLRSLFVLFFFALTAAAETFEEKCRAAGGQPSAACACPDGRYINPYVERCESPIAPARTLQAFEDDCAENEQTFVGSTRYGFATLKQFILEKNIGSPEDLVQKLAADPKLRELVSQYVLIWGSRSTQTRAADADFPRRVFFRGGLIFASVEHPAPQSKPLNRKLEVIEVDEPSGDFIFREIHFGSTPPEFADSPKSCRSCHGEKSRPLWFTYRAWPGAYNHGTNYLFPKGPRPLSGSYSVLRPTSFGEDTAALNAYLNRLNFRRIENKLEASADFERYRLAAIGAILKCSDLPSFLGKAKAVHEADGQNDFARLLAETRKKIDDQYEATRSLARRLQHSEAISALRDRNDLQDVERVTGLRYLFESRGVDVKNFSLYYPPGRKTHGFGFHEDGSDSGGLRRLLCRLLPKAIHKDSELKELTRLGVHYLDVDAATDRAACEVIRKKSAAGFL